MEQNEQSNAFLIQGTEFGTVRVRTVDTPPAVEGAPVCSYTYSGRVAVLWLKQEIHPKYLCVGMMDDDGSNYRTIFEGIADSGLKDYGFRNLPFPDNKRIHLGSFVLEAEPDLDHCEKAALVPIIYPQVLDGKDVRTIWSEPVVSQDNLHVAWTFGHYRLGSLNFIAKLVREGESYVHRNIQLISDLQYFTKDGKGNLQPVMIRGGELKQFTDGGRALTLSGGLRAGTSDSIFQSLETTSYYSLTSTYGYDETTMISPDQRLGVVMSTRFSENADIRMVSLLPRPFGGVQFTLGIMASLYTYGVHGARFVREGANVGPALVRLTRAESDPDYLGVNLSDPEKEWVFCSPISWHPDGKSVMWMEMRRGDSKARRARIAELPDYEPGEVPEPVKELRSIPYAVPFEEVPRSIENGGNYEGPIQGTVNGWIDYLRRTGEENVTHVVYHHFSNDGLSYWDGEEKTVSDRNYNCVYEGHVRKTGEDPGVMDLRLTFKKMDLPGRVVRLDFNMAEDGKPASYGYAEYGGRKFCAEDLNP